MPSSRGVRGTPIGGRATVDALTRTRREAENVVAAVRGLLADARRGPKMATAVEQRLAGLGAAQLRDVIRLIWQSLAEVYAAQRNPRPGDES